MIVENFLTLSDFVNRGITWQVFVCCFIHSHHQIKMLYLISMNDKLSTSFV